MDLNLEDRYALVGGGSKGLGHASAVELALLGATVVLAARNEEALAAACRYLPRPAGQTHTWLAVDYDDTDQVQAAIGSLLRRHPVHILVNNSGGPPGGPVTDAGAGDFLAAFRRHLIVNQLLAQAVLPGMKAAGYGRIINIISTSVKQPLPGLGVSNTVRGAVANWAKTLSNEVAPLGITVNNVLPGATATDRLASIITAKADRTRQSEDRIRAEMEKEIPMGRFGTPPEFGAAVAFLASPAASYITGINLPVDGGRTACL